MSYSGTPTIYGEQQIAAAYQSGTRLAVTQIAVGDGGGSPVSPVEGQTKLVNEVWRGAIASWGVDPADTRRIVVEVTIPATAGPFTIREAGVIDSSGNLVAVTAVAATELVGPGTSNQATSVDLIVALPIGSAGALLVSPLQGERFTVERLYRTPFISINSATVTLPPANPAVGDLYIVPQNASGAWATAGAGAIAEWNGTYWAFLQPPLKMVAGIMDAAEGAPAEYLKWNGAVWEQFDLRPADVVLLIQQNTFFSQGQTALFTTPGSGIWTVPAGVYRLKVTIWGAGGGGGGAKGAGSIGSGGGCGKALYFYMSVVPGQQIPWQIGAGGVGGSASGGNGGTSGITFWGSGPVSVSCYAAQGGTGSAGGIATTSGKEGVYALGSSTVATPLPNGGSGIGYQTVSGGYGGLGGASYTTTLNQPNVGSSGYPANQPGNGGNGGSADGVVGSDGANGKITVEY